MGANMNSFKMILGAIAFFSVQSIAFDQYPGVSYIDVDGDGFYNPAVDYGPLGTGPLQLNVNQAIANQIQSTGSFDASTFGSNAGLYLQGLSFGISPTQTISIRAPGSIVVDGKLNFYRFSGEIITNNSFLLLKKSRILASSLKIKSTGSISIGTGTDIRLDTRAQNKLTLEATGSVAISAKAYFDCANSCLISGTNVDLQSSYLRSRIYKDRLLKKDYPALFEINALGSVTGFDNDISATNIKILTAGNLIDLRQSTLVTTKRQGIISLIAQSSPSTINLTGSLLKTEFLPQISADTIIGYTNSQPFIIKGFGSRTTGPLVPLVKYVTNLEDSLKGNPVIPGSLRAAINSVPSTGATIRFSVSGIITIKQDLIVPANTIIDGLSSPGFDGITLKEGRPGDNGKGLLNVYNSNVIIRGLKIRGSFNDGIQIASKNNSSIKNIVIDHCSVTNSTDGGIDMGGCVGLSISACSGANSANTVSDVTLSGNYLAGNGQNIAGNEVGGGASQVKYGATRISYFQNFLDKNQRRNPVLAMGAFGDIRNNVMQNSLEDYVEIQDTASVNVVSNSFIRVAGSGAQNPITAKSSTSKVYASGNTATGFTNQASGNQTSPLPMIFLDDSSPVPVPSVYSASYVQDNSGVRPFDAFDLCYRAAANYSEVKACGGP